jgi:antitoxin PrlF
VTGRGFEDGVVVLEDVMALVTRLTRKGQLTIPKAVRDQLGLKPFDKVEVVVADGEARLRKSRATLDDIAGTLPPLKIPLEKLTEVAKEERARRFAAKRP